MASSGCCRGSDDKSTMKRKLIAIDVVDLKKNLDRLDRHLDRVLQLQSSGNEKKRSAVGGRGAKTAAGRIEKWEINIDSGKLVVGKLIGQGAFSDVYRGSYQGQKVAVKILKYWKEEGDEGDDIVARERRRRAQLTARLRYEASLWHKLHHPNVCEFLGAATSSCINRSSSSHSGDSSQGDPACCLITRYLGGGTLKSYLETRWRLGKKLPLKEVVSLSLQLARGTSYLHSHNVIHRDVKPENAVLDSANRALKIIDFGAATLEPVDPTEFADGGLVGTIGYMAPEVFEGGPYDHKCDVYSFGISLRDICCCNYAFANYGLSKSTSVSVYKTVRPEIPKNCPESLAEIMKQCWEVEPARRPTMKDVVSMIEAIDPSDISKRTTFFPPPCFLCFGSHKP